jgi:endonuclease/exonuclease/phosphatase family metal-dependent hydrolase
MRIGTYNVLGLTGFPRDEAGKVLGDPLSEQTAGHFAGVFSSLGCDILALQEGVALAQIQKIALAMSSQVATMPSPIAWSGHVITRFPILESRVYSHPRPDAANYPFSRTAGAVLLSPEAGLRLWVVNLHLHPSRLELRNAEAEFMAERIDLLLETGCPVIVLGDLNCLIEEAIHIMLMSKGFTNAMVEVGGGLQPTMDTAGVKGEWAIDHIYVSRDLAGRLTGAEVIRREGFRYDEPVQPGRWVHSDHLPVVATLDYP